jgi:hypothetical protein
MERGSIGIGTPTFVVDIRNKCTRFGIEIGARALTTDIVTQVVVGAAVLEEIDTPLASR